jgi:biopolymer transport protein TolR
MAIQVHGGRFRRKRFQPMSDINVTPFVDVMLVLLVVFMIAAPLLSVGVPVELPKAVAPTLQGLDEPLAVTIDKDGQIFLQEKEVKLGELVPALIAITAGNQERRIFVRGDQSINYGRVIAAMGAINAAGFTRVALVAQAPSRVGQ